MLFFLFIAVNATAASLQAYDPARPAGQLKLKDMTGGWHKLDDYRGHVILVNFWGSWCHACVEEMPSLQRLNSRLKQEGLVVLAVNVNQSKTAIQRFLQAMSLNLTVLQDSSGKQAKAWQVDYFPSSFIIDKNLMLRFYAIGQVDWDDETMEKQLKELLHTE